MSDTVYLLVDGENIDRTLGQILDAKPRPEQRPRWDRIRTYVENAWGRPCKALFFLNARRGLPGTFIQALRVAGYAPIPLSGDAEQKVVDIAIVRTLEAIAQRPGDVVLASHDVDFYESFSALIDDGQHRRLGVIAFQEYLSGEYQGLERVEIHDLEDDVSAFSGDPLPRLRVIPIESFDPNRFL
ncbi:MAG: nuclease [Planctomycetes bacterium]|nr:nuclease [Planctomycetota bacterium]